MAISNRSGGDREAPRPGLIATEPDAATVRLDRTQREAIRRELAATAGAYGAFESHVAAGEREAAMRELRRLRGMFAVLDAIGWTEQREAPDEQPITVSSAAGWWARSHADAAGDHALALGALREIGARDVLPLP
jgi:hypothetical protein